MFYDPTVATHNVRYQQTLQHICHWANTALAQQGLNAFVNNKLNQYDIANLVKLNMWVSDIKQQGVIKPLMLYYDGQQKFGINNGESRLRALERIPAITGLPAFICIRSEHAGQFQHLEQVHNFDQFARLCAAVPGQKFLFKLTDANADYGIYWYEYNSSRTTAVTPGDAWCLDVFENYVRDNPDIEFTPAWFDTLLPWADYKSNN